MNNNNLPFPIPNLQQQLLNLGQLFGNVTNSDHKQIENYLMSNRVNLEHIISLIEFLKIPNNSKNNLIACSIEIKNIFKLNYKNFSENMNQGNINIYNYIKDNIVEIYLNLPKEAETISTILLDCIRIFVKYDFPEKWPQLTKYLSASLQNSNHFLNYKVFSFLYKITKKYEYLSRSDKLYSEIILVTETFHEKILFYAGGYINSLMQNNFEIIYLENLVKLLKIVYNLIYQDIHEYIEDNMGNWAKLLKDVLSPQFQMAFENAIKNEQNPIIVNEIKNFNFICKGEVIKIILLFSTKYKDDFEDHIKNFAEDIWKNCISLPLSDNKKTKLLVNSVKYFKSFSQNKEYFSFFKNKMNDILTKLVIPGFLPGEEDYSIFQYESKAFTEKCFSLIYSGNKKKQIISEFIETLSKFYRNELLTALEFILKELIQQRSIYNINNEIVYIQIFINTVVKTSNSKNGAMEIICPIETVNYIYKNLIETFLSDFLKNFKSMNDETALLNSLFLISYHIQYISIFKNFMDYDKILSHVTDLFVFSFDVENESYQFCLLSILEKLIDCYEFEIINNLNVPTENLSFYQKYYMNPSKIILKFKKINRIKIPKTLNNINFNNILKILEKIYNLLTKNKYEINCFLLQLLNKILEKTDKNTMEKIEQPYKELILLFLNSLINEKITLNSSLVNSIFLIISSFIEKSSNNDYSKIEALLLELMKKNNVEFMNLTLQIFSIIIKKNKIDISKNTLYKNLFENCFNLDHYQGEMLGVVPSFLIFIKNCVILSPELINNWQMFSKILLKVLSNKMITVYFSFLKDLLISNLNPNNIIVQSFMGLKATLENNDININLSGKKDDFVKQILYTGFLELICIFIKIYSFKNFYELLKNLNLYDMFSNFIVSPDFFNFLSRHSKYDSRNFIILILSSTIFDEKDVFYGNNLNKEYFSLANIIMENIWGRKKNSRNMSRQYNIKKQEKDFLNSLSNNCYSNSFILDCNKFKNIQFISDFLMDARKNINNFDSFIINKFADLIQKENIPFGQLFNDNKYMELFKN